MKNQDRRGQTLSPPSPYFFQATFRLDRNGRNLFHDEGNNLVILPLWSEGGK